MGAVGPEILLLAAAAAMVRIVLCEGWVCRCGVWLCVVVHLVGTHKSTFDGEIIYFRGS